MLDSFQDTLSMRTIASLVVILFLCFPAYAQEVEFNIPTEIDIVQGQLSIVFKEDVSESQARQYLEQLPYDILDVNFFPVLITGELEKPLDEKVIQKMREDKRILTVEQQTTPGPILDTNVSTETGPPRLILHTSYPAGTSSAQAKKALKKHVRRLESIRIESLPNEIIVDVGDQDEEAFDLLQSNKIVKWVSYVGAPAAGTQ